jgi:hypothetical protein
MTSLVFVRGHQCILNLHSQPNLIQLVYATLDSLSCPRLPSAKADTRLGTCNLWLSMHSDVCCGAYNVTMPPVGAFYTADWVSANHLLDGGIAHADVHVGGP